MPRKTTIFQKSITTTLKLEKIEENKFLQYDQQGGWLVFYSVDQYSGIVSLAQKSIKLDDDGCRFNPFSKTFYVKRTSDKKKKYHEWSLVNDSNEYKLLKGKAWFSTENLYYIQNDIQFVQKDTFYFFSDTHKEYSQIQVYKSGILQKAYQTTKRFFPKKNMYIDHQKEIILCSSSFSLILFDLKNQKSMEMIFMPELNLKKSIFQGDLGRGKFFAVTQTDRLGLKYWEIDFSKIRELMK